MAKTERPNEALKRWRGERPQHEAAHEIGLNPTIFSRIESGKYVPGRKIAKRIEAVVRIPCEAWGAKAA